MSVACLRPLHNAAHARLEPTTCESQVPVYVCDLLVSGVPLLVILSVISTAANTRRDRSRDGAFKRGKYKF